MTMRELLEQIERVLPDGGEWCTVKKASVLAALVVGLRPMLVVEIGVWRGGSAIPIALALRHNGSGRLLAIDPWSADASLAGQEGANAAWWSSVSHEESYRVFMRRIAELELGGFVHVHRVRSDDSEVPGLIDILHVDGNHSEQAIRDVERFAPSVRMGGIVIMDDIAWAGGSVGMATERLTEMGFVWIYELDTGAVFQRYLGGKPA